MKEIHIGRYAYSVADEVHSAYVAMKLQLEEKQRQRETKIYRYKDRYYLLLDEAQYKHPETREWQAVVIYQDECGVKYSRDLSEFYERFSQVHSVEFDSARSLLHLRSLTT